MSKCPLQRGDYLLQTGRESGWGAGEPMSDLASAPTFQSDETSLIAGLRAGSEEAFEWLLRALSPAGLLGACAYRTDDRVDAAALTQEVFVKALPGSEATIHGENRRCGRGFTAVALREASNQRRWWMRHKQQGIPIEHEI
jgi:RNA polymerase sigma-70 factor (ECF subfamily)